MNTHRAPNANPNATYQNIAQHYRDLIDFGDLKPGTQLPIIEQVAEEHKTSRSTAHKAMLQLTQEGYTYSRQSGNYVLMGGAVRLYAVLEKVLQDLAEKDQYLTLSPHRIRGRDGAVARDTETGTWTRVTTT